jgi:hypothetical protein
MQAHQQLLVTGTDLASVVPLNATDYSVGHTPRGFGRKKTYFARQS